MFTCTGTGTSIILEWQLNDSVISIYIFEFAHIFPQSVPLTPQAPAVVIQIISAHINVGSTVNIVSTLSVSDVTIVNGSSLYCEDGLTRSNTKDITVNHLCTYVSLARIIMIDINYFNPAPPPPPSPSCTIVSTSESPAVTFQWSDDFNSMHVIEHYDVSVTPNPSSCSSDQVPPSEDYSCSGLELMTNYSIVSKAANCGDQRGERSSYWIHLQGINYDLAAGPSL